MPTAMWNGQEIESTPLKAVKWNSLGDKEKFFIIAGDCTKEMKKSVNQFDAYNNRFVYVEEK